MRTLNSFEKGALRPTVIIIHIFPDEDDQNVLALLTISPICVPPQFTDDHVNL